MVAVSLEGDDRGRVPFALIGALLLVSTSMYTTGLVHEAPREPVAPRIVETATRDARLHLATVARDAGREAARHPVLVAGDTPIGRLIRDAPFERSLALRIAVGARETFPLERRAEDVTVRVDLPPVTDLASTRRALDAVHLERLGSNRVRVTLDDATVAVRRSGRVVERADTNLSATVGLPAIPVHERVEAFERRLNAGVAEPGLARALTLRLYALAWVRGYAQYGGAPIANVVANRHVGLLTNDALVDQQAAAFGRADPDSRRAVARAAAQVAVVDGLAGVQGAITGAMQNASRRGPGASAPIGAVEMPSSMDERQRVGADTAADEAFVSFVAGSASDLDAAVQSAYRARVRPDASARRTDTDVSHSGDRPSNGTLAFTTHDTEYDVSGGGLDEGEGSTLLVFERAVSVTETEHSYWLVNGTYAGSTSVSHERTYAVAGSVRCRYDRPSTAPAARIRETCPFGTAARSDLVESAERALDVRYGGADAVALAAVRGRDDHRWARIAVEPPEAVRDGAYRGAANLRDAVRDVHVEADRLSMVSGSNPSVRLARTIRGRRSALVGAPSRYDSAATVARYAARVSYLDALLDDLEEDGSVFGRVQRALGDAMARHAVPSRPPSGRSDDLQPIATDVDADPRYLSLAATGPEKPPLAARNLNLFTVPYGDAADAVGSAIGGDDADVSLSAAVNTLAATNRALATDPDPALRARRDRLRRGIERSLEAVRTSQRRALERVPSTSRGEVRAAIEAGYADYGSVRERGEAVVDGSIAGTIAGHLSGSLTGVERDRARVELRTATVRARRDATVRLAESTVSAAADRARPVLRTGAQQVTRVAVQRGARVAKRRAFRKSMASMPAGLPLLPVPGQWYATANVWVVSVRGGYERFAVHAPRATPVANGTVTYVRESTPVRLDVDGDGYREVLGRNRAIDLAADTGVVVVVPPGAAGVGDTDGNADERSPGW
ncbi:MAG: hypothetical protein ABEJ76_01170 [Halanaeroarchaeum sp.]